MALLWVRGLLAAMLRERSGLAGASRSGDCDWRSYVFASAKIWLRLMINSTPLAGTGVE